MSCTVFPADIYCRAFQLCNFFFFLFKLALAPVNPPLGLALEKKLLTRLHWIGHKHCISVIGWTELIHAGGSLSACLLLLTNLRGKIGIQLVWPEELSLSLFPSLTFVIHFLGSAILPILFPFFPSSFPLFFISQSEFPYDCFC